MEDHTAQLAYRSGRKKPLTTHREKVMSPRLGLLGAAGVPNKSSLPGVSLVLLKDRKIMRCKAQTDQLRVLQGKTPC